MSVTTVTVVVAVLGLFASIADGSVLVAVLTNSADNTDSGNVPAALALLKSARNHLHKVEARQR